MTRGDVRKLIEMGVTPKGGYKIKLEDLTTEELMERKDFYEMKLNKSSEMVNTSYVWDRENPRYFALQNEINELRKTKDAYDKEISMRNKEKVKDLESMTEEEIWTILDNTIENCSSGEDVNKIGEITRYVMDKALHGRDIWDYVQIATKLSKQYFPEAYEDPKNVTRTRISKEELGRVY
jgi:hypothetical protein